MIVSELIEQLKTMPQDAIVLTRGYESGYYEPDHVTTAVVVKAIDPPSYDGDYDLRKNIEYRISEFEDKNIQAVLIV